MISWRVSAVLNGSIHVTLEVYAASKEAAEKMVNGMLEGLFEDVAYDREGDIQIMDRETVMVER